MFEIALAIQVFVLLNPLSSFPFLIAAYQQKMDLRIIALKAVLTAFIIAAVMAVVGPGLFQLFGITLDSFRIAGGLVLIMLGYHMVRPKEEKEHKDIKNIDSMTTIIATPMLTGPGTISFVTVKTIELGQAEILSSLVIAFFLVGIVFFMFSMLVSKINPKLVNILSRILGLFLMAVAIEMIGKGLHGMISAVL